MASISGFPEFLPPQQLLFEQWKETIGSHFKRFGFIPLETPAVERLETLMAKGDDHEIYGLYRLGDLLSQESSSISPPKGKLGLRFDLTVPLARYVAQHHGQLTFPFRRYHIAPVWRGERPQSGRYRQFYQCDIDVIGRDSLSPLYDSEIASMMWGLIQALNLGPAKILINHRGILLAWLKQAGITDPGPALRLIDKRGKMPMEEIYQGLKELGASSQALKILCQWAEPNSASFALPWENAFHQDVKDLFRVKETMEIMGVPSEAICVDPLLARGLTYYTGTIYEIFLTEKPHLGAICAGGRYGHLAESFSRIPFPGVGMSFGLSRVFSAFVEQKEEFSAPAEALITVQEPEALPFYLGAAQTLRHQGIAVETYLDLSPLASQLKYADRKGFPFVIMANRQEIEENKCQIKCMRTRRQQEAKISDLAHHLHALKASI